MLNKSSSKIAVLAVLMSLSLIFSYIESLISFGFIFPGFRIGLSNIAVVMVLYAFGSKHAFLFGISKVFLSLLFLGRLSSFLFSLTGMVLSLAVMILIKRAGKFSIYAVSACGAVFHIWGQVIASSLYVFSLSSFIFIPWLSLLAVVSGLTVGVISRAVLHGVLGLPDEVF